MRGDFWGAGAGRWVGIVLMVVLAVAAWRWLLPGAAMPASTPSAMAQPRPTDSGDVTTPAPPEDVVDASPAASAVPAVDPDCPREWRSLTGLPASAVDARITALRQQAVLGASSVLVASADVFERMVGQLLAESATRADGEPDLAVLEGVVDAARTTRDPRVAALAFQACHSAEVAAVACRELSAAGWADIDGANMHAWLAVAATAKDRGARNRAMARAASVLDARSLWSDMQRVLASPQLASLNASDRVWLAGELRLLSGVYGAPGLLEFPLLCSDAELQSPTRRSQCRRIAEWLIEGDGSLTERGAGLSVARLTGWAPHRIDELEKLLVTEAQAAAAATAPEVKNTERLTLNEVCQLHRAISATSP